MKHLKQKQKDALERFIQTTKKTGEMLRSQAILMLDDSDSHTKVR